MNSLKKNLDKPITYGKWFDKINNFSIFYLDDLFKLYDEYLNFLSEENKIKTNSSGWHKNQKNNFIKSDYNHKKKSNLTNYNNWPSGVETGLLEKDEYLKQISNNWFSGNFIFFNLPFEIFDYFYYLINSNIGLIKYFIEYVSSYQKWNDDDFVNEKIKEIDNLVPYWNHNFPIFIFKDILEDGLLMPLTNNNDNFLGGGIHRYICQSLCKRPIPMFIKIPTRHRSSDLNTSWFINDDEIIFPSVLPLFQKPTGSKFLDYLVLKINIKSQKVNFYLTDKMSREINDDYLEIGYCDYKTDTYQIYEF